jgi:23S rRNA pseudouridine1911/1915/1917 synthase
LKTISIEIAAGDDGRTIQAVLHDHGGFSHNEARGLIDAGAVRRVPGAPVAPGDYALRVRSGERYEATRDPGRRYRPRPALPEGRGYRVLHQDRDLLVVDKHAHLLSVPTSMRKDEESLVDLLLAGERGRGVRHPALYALQRLDRDTSGILLFARTREAFERLQEQLIDRSMERRYIAVAEGRLAAERGVFESRLIEDPTSLKVHSTRLRGQGRPAITEYEVTERLPGATVLDVRLRTGRKNQIRVHLAEAGHPLVGDRKYGRPSPLIGRTALHARTLGFAHPATDARVAFESPAPSDLKRLLKALRRGEAIWAPESQEEERDRSRRPEASRRPDGDRHRDGVQRREGSRRRAVSRHRAEGHRGDGGHRAGGRPPRRPKRRQKG